MGPIHLIDDQRAGAPVVREQLAVRLPPRLQVPLRLIELRRAVPAELLRPAAPDDQHGRVIAAHVPRGRPRLLRAAISAISRLLGPGSLSSSSGGLSSASSAAPPMAPKPPFGCTPTTRAVGRIASAAS